MATEPHSGTPAAARPSGTVTFLFSDIEGSTARWEANRDAMRTALVRHDALMRQALEAQGGYVFKVIGDAFCATFGRADEAAAAAVDAQRALAMEDFSAVDGMFVRIALHTGTAYEIEGDYLGPAVNRAARLLAAGHGGQVLVSAATADLLEAQLPQECRLRDLGTHRLKDLTQAERVYQLLAPQLRDAFPALRSIDAFANNLPLQLTSFVGREHDVAAIGQLLQENRLVTLVGTAGAGKTRCAIQVAAELLDRFEDGAWLVELAPLSDPSLVANEIAQTLGVRETPNRSLLQCLLSYLEQRRMLLILDNCEHVIGEARGVAAAILRGCRSVRILATSRENLSIAGEQLVRLPSLAVPPAENVTAETVRPFAAVELFTNRALAANRDFVLTDQNAPFVTEICRRLDGLPLALELAAARIRMFSPQQLAQRLDTRFRLLSGGDRSVLPRHQALRAAIDWSFDLLEPAERAVFRRLAIFAGGWTLEAASEVCADEVAVDEWGVVDAISSLVDKSLVVVEAIGEERRYRMLGSIGEYALERLGEAGETEASAAKHARFYASFLRKLQPLVVALEDVEWKRLLLVELDNIRAAIDWTVFQRHQPEIGLALLADLEWPELITTLQEAMRWYESAATLGEAMPNQLCYSRLLRHCAVLEYQLGRPVASSERTALRAVDVARSTHDPDEIARALANLAAFYRSAARFDEAERVLSEAYEASESLSRITVNSILRVWAVTDLQRGAIDLARRRFSQVVQLERPGSEAHASALLNLGELEFATGHVEAARAAARLAKETYTRLDSIYLVLVLSNLAAYAIAAGDLDDARGHLRGALQLHARVRAGRFHMVLENHALFAATLQGWECAALLLGFTDAQYASRGEVRQYTERYGRERVLALLSEVYTAEQLHGLMIEGSRLTEEQALAHAAAIHDRHTNLAATPPKVV